MFRLLFFVAFLCLAGAAHADETGVTDDGAVARSDGEVEECEGNVEINKGGLSIGSVRNNGGEMKNVRRCTKMDNVTIISNGKTTVYRKNAKVEDGEERPRGRRK